MKTITDNALADALDKICQGQGQEFTELFTRFDVEVERCEAFLHKFGVLKQVKVVGFIEHDEDDKPEDFSYYSWQLENFPENL